MRVEILCTGDEILTGKTINTNHSHIAQRLARLGHRLSKSRSGSAVCRPTVGS